jgi:hypothetical protein
MSRATLDATGRRDRQYLPRIAPADAMAMVIDCAYVLYCPGGRHGHWFLRKKSRCGVVKSLFEASVQKAQNGPSAQIIKAWAA